LADNPVGTIVEKRHISLYKLQENEMNFRTIVAIVITISLTILIMQNADEAIFTVFSVNVKLPKVAVLTATSVGGFLLGILVSRPRKQKVYNAPSYPEDEGSRPKRPDTLSDEDREYIS
jgi:uncharacterized integral membrane protein